MKTSLSILAAIIAMVQVLHSQNCTQCDNTGNPPGNYASETGIGTTANGEASFAGGYESEANGAISFSFGNRAITEGTSSVALGQFVHANSYNSMVIGTGASLSNKLTNGISKSLMIGFGSEKPTLFVGGTGPGLTGKVGIGNVTDPQAKLHIKADNLEAAEVFVEPHMFGGSNMAAIWLGTKEYGIRARWGKLEFKVGNDGRYLFSDGFVGIGTTNPVAELQVNGNVFIEKDNAGLILKSPDGQCWKITVNNTGELTTTSINCNLTTDIDANTPVENSIRIFPNPTSGELTIEAGQELHNGRVSIFSMAGRQLYSEPLQGMSAKIDLSHLQSGVYIVNIEGGGQLIKSQQVVLK